MIEAANAEEEALAIAVALREAVAQDKTAALVTPDRALARRVVAALGRWNIEADDSGGDALPDTEAGVFARLVAQAALGGLEPVTLLALCKHARFRLGAAAGAHTRAIAALELAVLRGPRPRPGTKGLGHALATLRATKETLHGSDPRKRITNADLDAAQALVDRLGVALAPLEDSKGTHAFSALAALHADAVRALSRGRHRHAKPHSPAKMARNSPTPSRRLPGSGPTCARRPAITPTCSRPRSPARSAAAPAGRARGCAFSAPSRRGSSMSTASCSVRWWRACGRPRRAPIRGCRVRCGLSSGSICPNGASGCRRTTSRSFSACPR